MLPDAFPLRSRMKSRSSVVPALVAALLVVVLGGVSAALAAWYLLPRDGRTAYGVRIGGEEVREGETPGQHVERLALRMSSRKVRLQVRDGQSETLTLAQLGLRFDREATLRRAMQIGRQGSVWYRLASCWRARGGQVNVPPAWQIDPTPTFDRILAVKYDLDRAAVPARYDFADKSVVPHRDGIYLDPFATVDALDRLVRAGGDTLEVVRSPVPPTVTASFLERLDISQRVGHFETRFGYLGGQANRAHNIATAASRLDGVVMLPHQIISFNAIVGHRTLDNGFRKGWEIFRGEMVEGVGGGTCQVASTLYASAFLAGLDVIERSPHSRPSGYIPMGLDATVVDGLVDLKLRNPFDFPIVLHSEVDKGVITFDLLGERRPLRVKFRGEVVGTSRYKRKVRVAHWLAEGRVIRKQRGIRGYRVRRVRSMQGDDGREREEVTIDVYPATTEIYLVPPGTDPEQDLPPLPHEAKREEGEEEAAEAEACEGACETPERPRIEDGPAARRRPPRPSHRVVIDR